MINQDELNYELYVSQGYIIDVPYYRVVTKSAASHAEIKAKLSTATKGFSSDDVDESTFFKHYTFGALKHSRDWISFFASRGQRLRRETLHKYMLGSV